MTRNILMTALLAAALAGAEAQPFVPQAAADSAYLFSYTTGRNRHHAGLCFAWSTDGTTWHEVGPEHAFISGDYGNWGPEKRMFAPSLRQRADGTWECIFRPSDTEPIVAYTTTPDLVHWLPQDYFPFAELARRSEAWPTPDGADPTQQTVRRTLTLATGGRVEGEVHRVPFATVQGLLDEVARVHHNNTLNAERLVDDAKRYAGLGRVETTVTVTTDGEKEISDRLLGIFFEDISDAADGGLYAELVQNRDFEYHPRDQRYRDPKWTADYAWSVSDGATLRIDSLRPIHANNPHYAVVSGGALTNAGWDGIPVRRGEKYDVSLWGRTAEGKTRVRVRLCDAEGGVLAETTLPIGRGEAWRKSAGVLAPRADCDRAVLSVVPDDGAEYHFDMVSLFPQQTYKGRKNGLRRDLAEALADMKPRFVRFPGGCVAHGDGLDNLYRWKHTVGPLEARVPNWNIWRYHQTVGLGYYEYFVMCEDLGAEPLPVLAAGVPCQNSACPNSRRHDGDPLLGQQGGMDDEELAEYIQDVLDLVEWANGDPKTSPWARLRAEAGHPAPFGLKTIGIGNEDLISKTFEERFARIYDAVKARYPQIEVVGTVGPFWEGADYEEGWRFAREKGVDIVDEHYYCPPGWFLNHADFYDRYRRGGTKVYLGEYSAQMATHRVNSVETALCEAFYLCNVERNADVVEMVSYAPLFAKRGYTRWNPDMIYFDNTSVTLTPGYHVQRLFGRNAGRRYLPTAVRAAAAPAGDGKTAAPASDVTRRLAASCVRDAATGDLILKVANLLPAENAVTVALPDGEAVLQPRTDKRGRTLAPTVTAEVLTGPLEAREVAPAALAGATLDGTTLTATLPAYSFAVIRISNAQQK